MAFLLAKEAKQIVQKAIAGSANQESNLYQIFDAIKEIAETGRSKLVWIMFDEDGNIYKNPQGEDYPLDFIITELRKLGYVAYTKGKHLFVEWN